MARRRRRRGIDPIAVAQGAMAAAALTVVMSASAGAKRPAALGNGGGFRRVMRSGELLIKIYSRS